MPPLGLAAVHCGHDLDGSLSAEPDTRNPGLAVLYLLVQCPEPDSFTTEPDLGGVGECQGVGVA